MEPIYIDDVLRVVRDKYGYTVELKQGFVWYSQGTFGTKDEAVTFAKSL